MFGFAAEKFLNKHCAKIVKIDNQYAIRRRHWFKYPFSLYEDEFADLDSLLREKELSAADNASAEGGYYLVLPSRHVQWWKAAKSIKAYCTTNDFEKILAALEILRNYVEPAEPKMPKIEVVDDIKLELAEYKLKK